MDEREGNLCISSNAISWEGYEKKGFDRKLESQRITLSTSYCIFFFLKNKVVWTVRGQRHPTQPWVLPEHKVPGTETLFCFIHYYLWHLECSLAHIKKIFIE